MTKPKTNQTLNISFVVLATSIVCANAFGATTVILVLLSFVMSLTVLGLAVYAIGFTNIQTSLVAITAVSVALSVWTSAWPTHARFQMAKPSFTQLEFDVRQGNIPVTPCWVGTYHVKEIQQRQAAICFWTDLHPFGKTGIVKSSQSPPPLNIALQQELGDNWHVVSED